MEIVALSNTPQTEARSTGVETPPDAAALGSGFADILAALIPVPLVAAPPVVEASPEATTLTERSVSDLQNTWGQVPLPPPVLAQSLPLSKDAFEVPSPAVLEGASLPLPDGQVSMPIAPPKPFASVLTQASQGVLEQPALAENLPPELLAQTGSLQSKVAQAAPLPAPVAQAVPADSPVLAQALATPLDGAAQTTTPRTPVLQGEGQPIMSAQPSVQGVQVLPALAPRVEVIDPVALPSIAAPVPEQTVEGTPQTPSTVTDTLNALPQQGVQASVLTALTSGGESEAAFEGEDDTQRDDPLMPELSVADVIPEGLAADPFILQMPVEGPAPAALDAVSASSKMAEKQPVYQQVSQAFDQVQATGSGVNLQLNPEHLGEVRIQLNRGEAPQEVQARLVVSSDETRQLLERDLTQLRASLEEKGIQLEKITIVVAGEASQFDPSQREFQREDQAALLQQQWTQNPYQQQRQEGAELTGARGTPGYSEGDGSVESAAQTTRPSVNDNGHISVLA
jgi:flagellar hook-length control protein FliK